MMEIIKQKISDFLLTRKLLQKQDKIFVGFSGGVDSLCMLDVLSELRCEYGFKLAAGHLNHNWRGEESKQEALKSEEYCKSKDIEFHTKTLPNGLPQTEEEAREQRYKFLNDVAIEISATAILTGHTNTDNVETVLYRILKGTGLNGLRGIPEVRLQEGLPAIYRPIINLKREDCIRYCKEKLLVPSVDPSNYNEKYLRNRIRHSLLPELRTYNNAIDNSIRRLSLIAKESEEIIEEYLSGIKEKVIQNNVIKTVDFLVLSNALKKRVLMSFLHENNIEYTFERIDLLLDFALENKDSKSGKTFSIEKSSWIFVSSKVIKIIDHTRGEGVDAVPVNLEGETIHPELGVKLSIKKWTSDAPKSFPKEDSKEIYVNLSEEKLYLRTRKPGDVIQPFGMKERTKLKKYLINRGIPEHVRDELPLLTSEVEVLWVTYVGISEVLRVHKIPSHVVKIEKLA